MAVQVGDHLSQPLCREEKGEGVALTRVSEDQLTCSCAPIRALAKGRVFRLVMKGLFVCPGHFIAPRPEVCSLLGDSVYTVSCEVTPQYCTHLDMCREK